MYFRARKNSRVITLSGLSLCLQHHLRTLSTGPRPEIVQLLDGSHSDAAHITVATTRVPDFTGDFAQPSPRQLDFGFRARGNLTTVCTNYEATMLPSEGFNPDTDILATRNSDNGVATAFFDTWEASGVVQESHLILVYIFSTPALLLPPPVVSRRNRQVDYPLPLARPWSSALSEYFTTPQSSPELHPFSDSPSVSSHSPSPPFGANYLAQETQFLPLIPPHQLSPAFTLESVAQPQLFPPPDSNRTSQQDLPEPVDLASFLTDKIPNYSSMRDKAIFLAGSKAIQFPVLARRFYAMERILSALQLPTKDSTRRFDAVDGTSLVVTALAVLKLHGWNGSTYSNKQGSYNSASLVAKRIWKGVVPTSSDKDYDMYVTFLGIQFLWRKDGPLDPLLGASIDPSLTSLDEHERMAAQIKQAHLTRCTKLLSTYTLPSPDCDDIISRSSGAISYIYMMSFLVIVEKRSLWTYITWVFSKEDSGPRTLLLSTMPKSAAHGRKIDAGPDLIA
ncbi:hypothetical protein C8F04DRAFT_1190373 [Mycena alexandri]|uniref:Uncharacterized protein n=1 Tax=Mycena alexandri TaxID=1745969 RepID=A0AAD6SGT5_9AGAR|nr:hypothetical protein C8F04DRAFT_1190373 [Mycena alexandri]